MSRSLNDVATLRGGGILALAAYKVFTISQNYDNLDVYAFSSCNAGEEVN